MALKSTVLAPPPSPGAPRATTVLRAGPPPKTGVLDGLLGVIGVVLLLMTVGMAVALPHKDVLPQQFKVAYLDTNTDIGTQKFQFGPGAASTHDFLFDVPADNVYFIAVQYEFADDVPASEPDQFLLKLYDPGGNQVGPNDVVAMNLPGENVSSGVPSVGPVAPAAEYKARLFHGQFTASLPKPSDEIYETPDRALTAPELTKQLEAKAHLDTKGTWKVKVTLSAAGGCATPTSAAGANRFAVCEQEIAQAAQPGDAAAAQAAAQGKDPGNEFSVTIFTYTTFAPDVQSLG